MDRTWWPYLVLGIPVVAVAVGGAAQIGGMMNDYPISPSPTTVVSVPAQDTASTGADLSGIGAGLIILVLLGAVALLWANQAGVHVGNTLRDWYVRARLHLGLDDEA